MVYKRLRCPVLLCLLCFLLSVAVCAAETESIGTVASTMTAIIAPDASCTESVLGDYAADCVRAVADADVAIVNGGDFWANLCGGSVSEEDVRFLFSPDRPLAVAEVTPNTLKTVLELAFSCLTLGEDELIDYEASSTPAYAQISGMTITVDATAPLGERVMEVTLDGETESLDLDDNQTIIRLAATEYMLSGGYGMPELTHEEIGYTLSDAVIQCIRSSENEIQPPAADRVKLLGTNEKWLFNYIPAYALVLVALFFAFSKPYIRGIKSQRRPDLYSNSNDTRN